MQSPAAETLPPFNDHDGAPALVKMALTAHASARSRPIVVWETPKVRAMSLSASPASRRASASRR